MAQCNHRGPCGRQAGESESEGDVMVEAEVTERGLKILHCAGFERGGRSYRARTAGGLWSWTGSSNELERILP